MSTAASTISDTHLTRRAVRGSSRAFEAIFRRYHQELYRYCAAIAGNSADAQDAVQNTMVKVLQALPGEERQIELKPWLYRIAHNEAIEIVRRRRPSEQVDADSLLGPANPAEQVEVRDRLSRLVADVAELPERQRGALVMRELGGLGFEQIGAALGTSAATARQTLYEARLGLRAMSEGREMDCAEAMRAISDGDRRLLRGRKLRAHLRSCESCRDFRAAIECRRADLALLGPLPAGAAAGIVQSVLGGAAAGKSLLGAAAIKTVATVGVVAAVGVTAADRGGLIHLGPGHAVAPPPAKTAPPAASASPPRAEAERGGSPAIVAPSSLPGAAGAARSAPGLSDRHPASRGTDAAPGQHSNPPQSQHPGAPERGGAAEASPPAVAPSPAHADHGRHLGQTKHAGGGPAATGAGGAANGKSAFAPGQAKPQQAAAEPPAPVEPEHAQPPPAPSPPAQAKQAPSEATATPAAEPAASSDSAPPEGPLAAEPAAAAHGKAGADRSTP